MRTITFGGDVWQVDSTGGSYHADHQHSMGVRFFCPATHTSVVGRLHVAPQDFAKATDDDLVKSLENALRLPTDSN